MSNSFDLEEFIPYRLAVAAEKVSEAFATEYRAQFGLSRAEWRILAHIGQVEEFLSVRDLERRVHLEKSKVSRAVSRMEGRGLLEKAMSESDGRLIEIRMTPKGQTVYHEILPLAAEFQKRLIEKLGAIDEVELMEALQILGDESA